MLKLMKDNIPGFDSRSSLFSFGTLLEFDDNGFISKFNPRPNNFVIKYDLLGSFNYLMIMVVKQLYKYMIFAGYEIPEFDWDVEERLWSRNGDLRLEEEEIDLIMKLINGELIDELNLLKVNEIKINMTSKKIIDKYFELSEIMIDNFKREMPYNIIDETDPLKKFILLRSLFSDAINNECGILKCPFQFIDERYDKSFKVIKNLILDLLGESDKLDVELIEDAFRQIEDINYPLTSEFLKRRQFGFIKKRNIKFEVTWCRETAIPNFLLNLMNAYYSDSIGYKNDAFRDCILTSKEEAMPISEKSKNNLVIGANGKCYCFIAKE